MTTATIDEAIREAERFIARAMEAKRVREDGNFWAGGPESAAAKRASMDLTRALARMRKP